MTDKQIIYDDVEVKDCIAYAKTQTILLGNTVYKQMEKVCMVKNQPCKFFDCQFKQMARDIKRKEQECEELRGVIRKDICSHYVLGECSQKHHNNCVGRNQCIKDLEQQLDQLKAENEELKNEYWKLEQGNDFLAEKNSKLKGCLTEIKEIAEDFYLDGEQVKDKYLAQDILQKISECEAEDVANN